LAFFIFSEDVFKMQAYENIKQRAKKSLSSDKMEMYRTGGGTFVPKASEIDEKVLPLLGYRATPLTNPYDADALYNHESGLFIDLIWYTVDIECL